VYYHEFCTRGSLKAIVLSRLLSHSVIMKDLPAGLVLGRNMTCVKIGDFRASAGFYRYYQIARRRSAAQVLRLPSGGIRYEYVGLSDPITWFQSQPVKPIGYPAREW